MQKNSNLNIVLLGLPGCGKSFMGQKLAKLLSHLSFVDLDDLIEKQESMTVSQIFEQKGEDYFRKVETELVTKISQGYNQIIALGGGAFVDENITNLKKNSITFYLKTSIDEIFCRIKNDTHRPLLNCDNIKSELKKLLEKREQNYLKADFIVETDNRQPYTILDDILGKYHNYDKQTT